MYGMFFVGEKKLLYVFSGIGGKIGKRRFFPRCAMVWWISVFRKCKEIQESAILSIVAAMEKQNAVAVAAFLCSFKPLQRWWRCYAKMCMPWVVYPFLVYSIQILGLYHSNPKRWTCIRTSIELRFFDVSSSKYGIYFFSFSPWQKNKKKPNRRIRNFFVRSFVRSVCVVAVAVAVQFEFLCRKKNSRSLSVENTQTFFRWSSFSSFRVLFPSHFWIGMAMLWCERYTNGRWWFSHFYDFFPLML